MRKNRIMKRLTLLASLVMLLCCTVGSTLGFVVTRTAPVVNTFTPFDSVVSNLLLTKTVEHPLGESYVIPENIAFDYQVGFGALYANTTIETSAGKFTADENGVLTLAVKPGQTLAVMNIDVGTKVTVTELQKEDSGFSVKDGVQTRETVIAENGTVEVGFVNVYEPKEVQPLNVTVKGSKQLVGRDWQWGDQFAFTLEQKTAEDSWQLLDTKTVTYDGDKSFDFTGVVQALTFDKVGDYTFRVTEVVGSLAHMTYDKTVNTFTVSVTDTDMDGKLEIRDVSGTQNAKVTEENGNYSVDISFSNVYTPPEAPKPEDISVTVTANKTVKNTGDLSIGPENFSMQLENVDSGEKLTAKTDTDGKAFFDLTFTAADVGKTFTYRLSEVNEKADGVTYDDRIYTVTVKIHLSGDNKLVAQCMVDGFVSEEPAAGFVNVYHKRMPASPPTGDTFPHVFWFAVLILSGAACLTLIMLGRRFKKKEDK